MAHRIALPAAGLAIMTVPTATDLNRMGADCLPGHLGLVITHADKSEVRAEMAVARSLMAPNGYLHAGSVVTLADTACGYACIVNLPEGATGFTTIELKSNFLGTAREGTLDCVATAQHRGPHHAGVGCRGHSPRDRQDHRGVSLHPDDPVAAIGLSEKDHGHPRSRCTPPR